MISQRVEFAFTFLPRRVAVGVGCLVVALAALVILGWFTGTAALLQVLPSAAPMRFNTAICLALMGLALIALGRGVLWLPQLLGGAIVAIALPALSQFASGGMAINTALACIFAGIACALLGTRTSSRWQALVECGCGALVFAIGAVSGFGYLSGLQAAYGWGGSAGMAVHTAVGLTVAGLALMVLAVGHHYEKTKSMPRWLPLPAIIIQLVATLAIAQALTLEELKKWDQVRQERVSFIAQLVEQQLSFRRERGETPDLTRLLADTKLTDLTKGYDLHVVDVSEKQSADRQLSFSWIRTSEALITDNGHTYRVILSRPWSLGAVLRRPIPIALLARSLMMTVVLGLAIHFAQRALERSIKSEELAAELRTAQARFRAIFDQTFQFIGLLSTDGTVLEANRSALRFAGIPESEVLGKPFWETPWWTHSPQQQEQLKDAVRRAAAGEMIRFEANHLGPDGTAIIVDFSLKPVRNEHGEVTLLIPEGRDITARLTAEARVRTSEQRLELAIRGSSDGIWDWNLATGEAYYSPRYKQLLGYQDDEFASDLATFHEHLHPDDAAATRAAIEANCERGEPFDATFRLRTKLGAWRWFRARGDVVRAADGSAQRMAGAMSDVTDAVLAEHELTRRARLDKLTGLPNRQLLIERLQHMLDRAQHGFANYVVMFLDFDRFKLVNDSLGHDVGDALLQAIARRLEENVCTVDSVSRRVRGNSVGRLGGDEFVILLDDLPSADEALALADRLLAAFAEPYQLGEHEVYSTASIGIVIGDRCYVRAEDALRDADVAMYEAKQRGKARYVVFDESMRQAAQRHLQLEHDLHKAVAGEQLSLAYEPLVSLSTGELLEVEALVRWEHPVEGEIDPAEFQPIAEESDLVHPLGAWALSAACRQMRAWLDELGFFAPRLISLNVSRKQFARRDFVELVECTLERTGLPADRLQLEVGQDVLTGDVEQALRTMQQLRELGVRLAVDDFGAGNGSFALLHRLPIQMLKVDRSLLADVDSSKHVASLLHALAVLVRNLGITLVANGVHRQGQWLALQELGCFAAQGSFVGQRMNADEVGQFVVKDRGVAPTTSGALAFANRLSETMSLEVMDRR